MSFHEKTQLNSMLSSRPTEAAGDASPGRRNLVEDSPDGGFAEAAEAAELEGGEGEKAPAAAPAAPAQAGKPSAGKITVSTVAAKGNPSTSRTTVGVGEKVTFTAQEEGQWRAGEKDLGTGQSVEWTAPPTASLVNVVFEPFLDSPNKNTQASVPMIVMAPNKVDFKKTGDVPVTSPGTAGVGMTLAVTIGPTNVSFGAVEWLEQPGPAEGVSGYFAAYQKTASLAHKPNPNWLPMGANNDEVQDNAWTKDKPKLMHPTENKPRWWAGSYSWNIPNHFRVKGGAAQLIGYVRQTFTMDDHGAITVTKGGASATAKPDNDLQGEIEKYPTVKDALAMLNRHGPGGAVQAVMNYKRNPKADPASVQNLIAALKQCNLRLYTKITCNNTFSWTDPDKVTVKANGKASTTGQRKINTNQSEAFFFNVNDLLNFSSMSPSDSITISAAVEDLFSTHPHSFVLGYPYSAKDQPMAGSNRYTISAFFTLPS